MTDRLLHILRWPQWVMLCLVGAALCAVTWRLAPQQNEDQLEQPAPRSTARITARAPQPLPPDRAALPLAEDERGHVAVTAHEEQETPVEMTRPTLLDAPTVNYAVPPQEARTVADATPRVATQQLAPPPAPPANLPPEDTVQRDRQLTAVSMRADARVRRGFEMAGRGALFYGRSEFIQALRLIAQNVDSINHDNASSEALATGMRALEEAASFMPHGSRLEAELDMDVLIASHRTPVLHDALRDPDRSHRPTPLEAQQRYQAFAEQQLATAAAHLQAGGMALYGLGKIHSAVAATDAESRALEESRAMTLYRAALRVDPLNPLASNELGVVLAHNQQLDEARAMLQRSAMIAPLPDTWHNLAVVHAQLGEMELSRRAQQQEAFARTRPLDAKAAAHPALARGAVRWVSPAEFAQIPTGDTSLHPPAEKTASLPAAPAPAPPSSGGAASWLPWTTHR